MSHTQQPLDRYGRMASQWCQTHRRDEWAQISDPRAVFARMSDEIRHAITLTQAELQTALPDDLDYLERVAAITRTRLQAEELVLADWFPEHPDPSRIPRPV